MHTMRAMTLIALAASACEPDAAPPSPATTERDSADIAIVENARPPEGIRLPWRIGPEPSLSIGVAEGDDPYMLFRAWGALRLQDGRIVLANAGTQELRVFDSEGTHLATWGGRGEGPGEFTGLTGLAHWPGDSIAAWYAPRSGIAVFDAQGNHGRTFSLINDDASPMQHFWPEGTTADGSVLAVHRPEVADTFAVQLRDGEGRVRSSLGAHPGYEWHIANEGTDRRRLYLKGFSGEPAWTPWGDLVAIANTSRYEIRAFAADGALARIVRRDHPARPPTAEEIEAHIEWEVARNSPATEAEANRLRRAFQAVPAADNLPAFASMTADATGHLWVEEYEAPGEEAVAPLWSVFDPAGSLLGMIETPPGLRIREIGEDYILAWTSNELGVEFVQLWPLER